MTRNGAGSRGAKRRAVTGSMSWVQQVSVADRRGPAEQRGAGCDDGGGGDGHRGRDLGNPGRARCPHSPPGRLVGPTTGECHHSHRLRGVLHLGRVREQGLLRGRDQPPGPPLALLLAVPRRQLRARQPPRNGDQLVDHLPGPARPHLPSRFPPHLLLLPAGLLPFHLALSSELRRCRRPQQLLGRDAVPAHPPERPPVVLLLRVDPERHPHHRRRGGIPGARDRHRSQRGNAGLVRERRAPVALQPVVPLLPASLWRSGQELLEAPDPPPAVEARDATERPPHEIRLGQLDLRGPHRPLRAPRGQWDHPRPPALWTPTAQTPTAQERRDTT
jgi:hypothetical protein